MGGSLRMARVALSMRLAGAAAAQDRHVADRGRGRARASVDELALGAAVLDVRVRVTVDHREIATGVYALEARGAALQALGCLLEQEAGTVAAPAPR